MKLSDLIRAGIVREIDDGGGGGGVGDPPAGDPPAGDPPPVEPDAAAQLETAQAENARLKQQLEEAQRAPAPPPVNPPAGQAAPVLDPFDQAKADLDAAGIPPYADDYQERLTRAAMKIASERTKAEVLQIVGQAVSPVLKDHRMRELTGGDPAKIEIANKYGDLFNLSDPRQREVFELMVKGGAAPARPLTSVSPERANTPPPQVTSAIKAEAAALALRPEWVLTDAEIQEALAEGV